MRLFLILTMLLTATLGMAKEITLTKDNTLVLDEAFKGSSVSKLITDAKKMDASLKSGYPIYLFLNTPGGSIQAGLELMEGLKGINRPIHTVTLFAASMGWQLVQHLGDRYILKYGVLMSHKARGSISGEFGGGFSQMDARYGLWLKRITIMDQQTVSRTGGKKTLKQYRSEYDNELWLNGEEAVKNGYADEVVSIKCGTDLSGTDEKVINYFGMRFQLGMSQCPIVTYPVSVGVNIRTNKGYMTVDKFLNEGGKFGKKCRQEDEPAMVSNYNGDILRPAKKAETCASDVALTLDKVNAKKLEVQRQQSVQKSPIYMSFGGMH
jgi:ATP-dependent protease ClpP protease subunit